MYYNDYNRFENSVEPAVEIQPKKKKTGLRTVALCLVCALVGGIAGGAGVGMGAGLLFPSKATIYESKRTPVEVETTKVDGHTALTVAQVYEYNLQSVVGINGDVKTNYWGQVVSNPVAGSGFVVTENGYIITNYHVIDGVSDLKVTFADGTTYDAVLVGGEEANDVAVLKIETTGLKPVLIADEDQQTRVGEQVVAIGNPLGELTFTLTAGYVSALDRLITMSDGNTINVMQTDAAINSGNSGGPLFNIYGECIGITNAKYSNNGSSQASIEGIGFAIPIHDVMGMVTDIIEKGYVTGKPNVGVLIDNVSSEATRRYGIPQGAYVLAVLEGACGDKAGIQAGDIITAVGETTVESSDALQAAVKEHKAGDTVTFTLYREGETLTVEVTLDESNLERSEALNELNREYSAAQQESQQQQQQPSQGYSFSWPFGWGW